MGLAHREESMGAMSLIWSFLIGCNSLKEYYTTSSWMGLDALSIIIVLISHLVLISIIGIPYNELVFSLRSTPLGKMNTTDQLISFIVCNSVMFFMVRRWIEFYFLFECVLLPTILLIIKGGGQIERYQASIIMILYTGGASLPLLIALLFWSNINSQNIFLGSLSYKCSTHMTIWYLFVILPFLVKLPVYLVHGWLPKAHVEAPLIGSVLLAGLLLKFGGYGLIRVIWFISISSCKWIKILIWISLWGGLLSSLVCLSHRDIKAIVAYSSIAHISLCLAGILSMYSIGKLGAVCIIFAHGVCSPAMFCLVRSLSERIKSRNIALRSGLLRVIPMWSFLWCIISIANIGVPPSLNFYSELFCVWSMLHLSPVSAPLISLILLLGGVYSLLLYTKANQNLKSFVRRPAMFTPQRVGSSLALLLAWLFGGFIMCDVFMA